MFSGMGQQNKILEAMAMERPCITTQMVDNAIGAAQQHALLIAEDTQTFAKYICEMISSDEKARRLGSAAREFVKRNYSWETKNKVLDALLSRQNVHKQTEPVSI
jgi:glycosyltransferase involved in cell wall biosynthesis